jgi:prepilin-type N-terminal cleavage/methylation domain-containing protein
MSTPSYGRPSHYARRGGFSLIEVAIALAIFVFGALAIVQIFPPALGVIRNNESRITATQLSNTLLAQFKNKVTPPPEAVFEGVYNTTTSTIEWQDYPAAVVGTSNKNASLPQTVTDFDASALGHFRYIYGEPHYIGANQTVFLNRPYDSTGGAALAFYDRTVEGVQIDENGYLDFSHAYLADGNALDAPYDRQTTPFNDGGIRPPENSSPLPSYRRTADPQTNTIYYVSYRWRAASNPTVIQGVLEEPISIPADGSWTPNVSGRVLPCVINSSNKVIPGAVRVRMRHGVSVSSSTVGGGVVAVSSSVSGLFYISYLSKDWREMTNDSAPVNNIVQLPVNGLEENSVFGVLTNSNYTLTPVPSTAPYPIAAVDYKKGSVTYSFPATTSARVRTMYRTLDGWATQTSVASRAYVPYFADQRTNDDLPREPWREYFWPGSGNQLYFHPSEAGKTVFVSYLNTAGDVVQGVTLTIGDIELSGVPDAGFFGSGNPIVSGQGRVSSVTITNLAGDPAAVASLLSVQGLSIHARTAWLNADKYNQVIVPAYRNLLQ